MMRGQDQYSRVFNELCSLVMGIMKSPHLPLTVSSSSSSSGMGMGSSVSSSRRISPPSTTVGQVSPAGFASLLLGISLALMLCGSVTFLIGFILMPWVVGLVMVLYLAGIVSNLSGLGRAILCLVVAPPPSPPPPPPPSRKEIAATKYM